MEFKTKIRELRLSHNMTQESVAEFLGVSSQTVSKWERGLLSPDIALLPKIAFLFQCSIDALFDMEQTWSIEHRRKFEAKIHALHKKMDWEGVYRAWVQEIELHPDHYVDYPDVMLHVLRKKLFDREKIEKMLSLAEHAEKRCMNDDIRNEIYLLMLQICSESDDLKIKTKAKNYYKKLPMLSHSREIYAKLVMTGEEYRTQTLRNIYHLIDLAECAVRQLITSDMPQKDKLYLYQKAAALYEIVSDDYDAGFFAPALLSDYYSIAKIHLESGETDQATAYVHRILDTLEKHITEPTLTNHPRLLVAPVPSNTIPPVRLCQKLLQTMQNTPEFEPFREQLQAMQEQYNAYFEKKEYEE